MHLVEPAPIALSYPYMKGSNQRSIVIPPYTELPSLVFHPGMYQLSESSANLGSSCPSPQGARDKQTLPLTICNDGVHVWKTGSSCSKYISRSVKPSLGVAQPLRWGALLGGEASE